MSDEIKLGIAAFAAVVLLVAIGMVGLIDENRRDPVNACIHKGGVPVTRVKGQLLELVECKFKEAK